MNFGKASCVNWVSYLYYLLETVSFLLTESGGEEVPPHCAVQPDVSVNYPEYLTSKQLVLVNPRHGYKSKSLVLFRVPLQSAVKFWPGVILC